MAATGGYTGGLTPWAKRRIIPIGSYIIATEPLAEAACLIPNNRVVSNTRKLVVYYRLSPDRRRLLFGTRIGQQVLGKPEGRTALDDIAFPARPYYWGNPWFLAASIGYYRWRDERGA